MRKNSATDFFAPSLVAKPHNTDEWMAVGRAALKVWVLFIIHVVQKAHCFPQIGIFAAQLSKMLHRVSDRVTMFPQALGYDPIVQNL